MTEYTLEQWNRAEEFRLEWDAQWKTPAFVAAYQVLRSMMLKPATPTGDANIDAAQFHVLTGYLMCLENMKRLSKKMEPPRPVQEEWSHLRRLNTDDKG